MIVMNVPIIQMTENFPKWCILSTWLKGYSTHLYHCDKSNI